ncbi:hypothetical protein ACSNOI_10615, partial [Actinomadura kijaniata]|uniref:hypothetical protein n=1 Tax=Actinomadura kijaniata TaxID=46161 RepID=UPI003F19DF82
APTVVDMPPVPPAPPAAPSAGDGTSTRPNALVPGFGDTPRFGTGPLSDGPATSPRNGRRPLLIGAGAAVALVVAVSGFALAGGGDDADGKTTRAARSPAASSPAKPSTAAKPAPVDINSEKSDTRPLTVPEAFPDRQVTLGGRPYLRDRFSLNDVCTLTANGAMAQALKQHDCRRVVRATYLDADRALAVTTGIAVLPDRAAAGKVSRAGDPSAYEWFRGLAGKRSPEVDQAGGYALSTVRGRYLVYAYAQYADGKKARPGDTALKAAAQQVLGYATRSVETRAGR